MEDIKAVVNNHGVVLYINFATDKVDLDRLRGELGGIRRGHAPDRIQVWYGNGLMWEVAKTILKRYGVPFEEGK